MFPSLPHSTNSGRPPLPSIAPVFEKNLLKTLFKNCHSPAGGNPHVEHLRLSF
ncbi:MAG TPA: hypothetical protein VEC36_04765 [Patescibacteria group bacterium]|nr:hypothetical protein [Patescibacteria group bacterium]